MAENTARLQVGRLLEIRAAAGYRNAEDVDAIFQAIDRAISRLPGEKEHITIVDWRHCPLMSPEAAKHMLAGIASTNNNTIRSAALARPESQIAVLQFVRLIRDADLPDRKLFLDPGELYSWLSEVLTPEERLRLKKFLDEDHEGD